MLFSLKNEERKYYTKEDVEVIVKDLSNNMDTIEEIDLTSNVFKPEAMEEICRVISKMKKLKSVILDEIFTTLNKEEMLSCFRHISLALKDKNLVVLDISNNALSSELPKEFFNLLSESNSLKFFKIRNCGLGHKGGNLIGECLNNLKVKNNLEYLDIAQNRFFTFPEKLSEAVMSLSNLSVLKLEYNTIEKITMTKFLRVLKNHPLEILDIRDNFLDVEGCRILGEIFATWNLRELMIGDCLAHTEGILEFIRYANKKFSSMKLPGDCKEDDEVILDLSHNDWEQECIEKIADFCEKYSIKKIFVNGNMYDDDEYLINAVSRYGGEVVKDDVNFDEEAKSDIDDTLINMVGKL
ncbi:hypothetical protein P3W45_001178 [Vairimorpha bombi]|jgi:Ran GTPase-activating protein 1